MSERRSKTTKRKRGQDRRSRPTTRARARLHSYFASGFIRTWRRSTTLSFETRSERLPPRMDARKGKTRKESTPIKVWVTPEEKAAIAAKADAHSLSASSYLRRLGLALPVESLIDQRAILDLVKINADLGRL